MAIEKMELLNIIAPIKDYDKIVDEYIIDHDVHIENALSVMGNVDGLVSFESGNNPYSELYKRVLEVCEIMRLKAVYTPGLKNLKSDEIEDFCVKAEEFYSKNRAEYGKISDILNDNNMLLGQLERIGDGDYKLEELFNFKFMRFRFGRMKRNSYEKLITFTVCISRRTAVMRR